MERYEDVVFDLQTPLNTTVGNGAHQKRVIFALLLTIPVKLLLPTGTMQGADFKENKLADCANIAGNDRNRNVNGSHSFIKNLDIKFNGKQGYDCDEANHSVNTKNLMQNPPTR